MNRNAIAKHQRIINIFAGVLFIFLVATIAHFLFSHLGFNPTDDGFILAGSRRILDGQIPHRDFISIRPAGSYFLHIPFVLFGGDYVFWVSRYFVWIQFASIAWIWTVIIARSFKIFSSWIEKFPVALVAFSFSAHYFPVMAWHTVDSLFLVTLGIILCLEQSMLAKMFGYLFIGTAQLCRLNFLPLIPIVIILLNDWRQKRFWLMVCVPITVYMVYLMFNRAVSDAIMQLSTYTNVLSRGVMTYVKCWSVLWGILIGALATSTAYKTLNFKRLADTTIWPSLLGSLILFEFILVAAW
ncbi:hypothetical protein MUP95_07220, partial [bacterium]|nr:hypothetical protein [bacterium]